MARRMNRIAVVGNLSLALALAAGPRAAHAQAFQGSGASAFSTGAAVVVPFTLFLASSAPARAQTATFAAYSGRGAPHFRAAAPDWDHLREP